MAIIGTSFNWIVVPGGTWTRIAQGPLIIGLPYEALELGFTAPPSGMVTFTLDGYNSAPPFYQRVMGTAFCGVFSGPPVGHTGSSAALVSFQSSPWVEFWLLVNRTCWAHISAI